MDLPAGRSSMRGPSPLQRPMSFDYSPIDRLTTQPENEAEIIDTVTRKHWKPSESVKHCSNRTCRKPFSLLERHHHCRKCGEVFCALCLQYKRKLNLLAHYDPEGRPYKVCKKCYEEGQSLDGITSSKSAEFFHIRQKLKSIDASGDWVKLPRGAGWRNRVNFDLEAKRLTEGFKTSIGKSEFRRTLHEMRSMVSVPDWQKASTWLQESTQTACQNCYGTFSLLKKRHHCKLCGLALCKSCSTADLLLYFADSEVQKNGEMAAAMSFASQDSEPSLAIIKVVGCPEVEPEVSLYLRVCTACREEIIRRQMERVNDEEAPTGIDMLEELSSIHSKFFTAETNVNQQLRDYQEIIDSLEDNTRRSSSTSSSSPNGPSSTGGSSPHSNMRTLAKAQEDLSDFLAQHVLVVQRLKRLVPKTESQSRLLKNYIRAKCDFYLENMSTFRQMKKKLSESSPPEVLEFIQRVMDKNAIISAHLYLRQLVYEMIHLDEKYGLQEQMLHPLMSLEQVIEKDVSLCLQREGEDFAQHLELMKELIRAQMKEHKLIRPSRRAVSEHGKAHVLQIAGMRTREILEQVDLQLKLKSANRSFPATKDALVKTSQQLSPAA